MDKYLSKNTQNTVDFDQTIKLQRNQLKSLQLENILKKNTSETKSLNQSLSQLPGYAQCNLQNIQEVTEASLPSNLKSLTTEQDSNNNHNIIQSPITKTNPLNNINNVSMNYSLIEQVQQIDQTNKPYTGNLIPIQYVQVDFQSSQSLTPYQSVKTSSNSLHLTIQTHVPTTIKEQESIHKQQTQTQRRLLELQQHHHIKDQQMKANLINLYIATTEKLKSLQKGVQLKHFLDIIKIKKPSKDMHCICDLTIKLVKYSKNSYLSEVEKLSEWDYIIDYLKTHGKLYKKLQSISKIFDDDIHSKPELLSILKQIEERHDTISKDKNILAQLLVTCSKLIQLQVCLFGKQDQNLVNKILTQNIIKHRRTRSDSQGKIKLIVKQHKNPRQIQSSQEYIKLDHDQQYQYNYGDSLDHQQSIQQSSYKQTDNFENYSAPSYNYNQEDPKIYLNEKSKVIHIDLSQQNQLSDRHNQQDQQTNSNINNYRGTQSHWSFNTPQTPESLQKGRQFIKIENQGYTTADKNNEHKQNSSLTNSKISHQSVSKNINNFYKTSPQKKSRSSLGSESRTKSQDKFNSIKNLNSNSSKHHERNSSTNISVYKSSLQNSRQQSIDKSNNIGSKLYQSTDMKRINLNPLFHSKDIINSNYQEGTSFNFKLNPVEQVTQMEDQLKLLKSKELEKKREQLIQQWTQTLLQEQDLQDKIKERLKLQFQNKVQE